MATPFLQQVSVDGRDIQKLIFEKLAPACEGEMLSHSVLAMLTFSALLMKPDIGIEELQNTIMETSEFMIMRLIPAPPGEAN